MNTPPFKENHDYFKIIFNSMNDAIIILDGTSFDIIDANEAAYQMYGYGREEILHLCIGQLSSNDNTYNPSEARLLFEKTLNEGRQKFEWRARKKNGELFWVEINTRPIILFDKAHIIASVRDTTPCKKIMETLGESEKRLRALLNAMPDIVCFKDGSGRWLEANAFDLKLFQLEGVDYRGKKDSELAEFSKFYYDAFMTCEETDEKTWLEGAVSRNDEIIPTPDGSRQVFDVIKIPSFSETGERQGLLVVGRNITERKLAEDALKISLKEKETLLRELYHRTKNNMQVISSMLALQAIGSGSEKVKSVFKDTTDKIKAMSLVHDKLYQSKDLSSINLKEYISELIQLFIQIREHKKTRISVNEKIDNINVLIDTAIPCGLIISELISNSLRHAFTESEEGTINISLSKNSEGVLELVFSDDGCGLAEDFDLNAPKNHGLKTMISLVEYQLRGNIEFKHEGGFVCVIKFTDNLYKPRV